MLGAYPFTIIFVVAAMFALLLLVPQSLTLSRAGRDIEPKQGASSTFAAVALVLAIFVPPVGLVLGHFALVRVSIGLGSGRLPALLAIWIGAILTVVEVVLLVVAFFSDPSGG
jgi:hypothetical protein